MSITIDLQPEIERGLRAQAQAKGVSLAEYVRQIVEQEARVPGAGRPATVFEHGLGLLGGPEDSAILDEAVALAYAERRRPSQRTPGV